MQRPQPFVRELTTVGELGAYYALVPALLATAPRGHGSHVLVIPGFVSGDLATIVLRRTLQLLGHRPHGWGLGTNIGPDDATLAQLLRRVDQLVDAQNGPIDIVGWSLGGVFGRLIAQHRPEDVRQVISLGSPLHISDPDGQVADPIRIVSKLVGLSARRRRGHDLRRVPVPSTSIYSRHDGVVAPASCVQHVGPTAENIEVRGAHCGLGHNLAAVYAVADRLAQPEGEWAPFTPHPRLGKLYPEPAVRGRPDLRVVGEAAG